MTWNVQVVGSSLNMYFFLRLPNRYFFQNLVSIFLLKYLFWWSYKLLTCLCCYCKPMKASNLEVLYQIYFSCLPTIEHHMIQMFFIFYFKGTPRFIIGTFLDIWVLFVSVLYNVNSSFELYFNLLFIILKIKSFSHYHYQLHSFLFYVLYVLKLTFKMFFISA